MQNNRTARHGPGVPAPCAAGHTQTARFEWRRISRACLLLVSLMVSMAPGAARAQKNPTEDSRAQDIANVVFGIASYVRWPAAHAELQMCVVGDARYADALDVGSPSGFAQRVRTQRLPGTTLPDCHIVYIGALDDAERDKLFAQLVGRPVLSITAPDVGCNAGSMFCLKFRNNQVAFEVNLDMIARSGLRVHPNVLQLAKRRAPQP